MSRNYKKESTDTTDVRDKRGSAKKPRNRKKGSNTKDTARTSDFRSARLPVGDRDNDPNWYFTDANLAEQASQLSFQSILGYGDVNGYKVPSVMKIPLVANPGLTYSLNENSFSGLGQNDGFWARPADSTTLTDFYPDLDDNKAGVNLMAAKLYTTLSSFTGRTASYAPQDVAMMILAISSIAEFSEHIRRVFGLSLTYNFRNRSLPLGIIQTMGIDVPDLIANISVYRMKFNVAMARINQIPLLENIAFIKKSRDIYQKVYVDDTSNMSQLYYYCPAFASVLDEAGDTDGSVLRAFRVNNGNNTCQPLSAWLDFLNLMITNVLESSTLNFIYADMLNMANKLNVQTWKFDYLAENYVVMPEYDANANMQLHNSTVVGYPVTGHSSSIIAASKLSDNIDEKYHLAHYNPRDVYITDGASVFCDTDSNNIVYNPMFANNNATAAAWLPVSHIVDMPTDNPSTVDRIEALRFKPAFSGSLIDVTNFSVTPGTSRKYVNAFVNVPDHYVAGIEVYSNIDWTSKTFSPVSVYSYPAVSTNSFSVNVAESVTKWAHGPLYYTVDTNGGAHIDHLLGDLNYYTTVNGAYIKRLLDIVTIGLFDFRV